MDEALTMRVTALAVMRAEKAKLQGEVHNINLDVRKTYPQIQQLEDVSAALAGAEEQLRAFALETYIRLGDKNPAPGIEIIKKKIVTFSRDDALAWGLKTGMAIALDEAAFKKIALASPGANFPATVTEEPAVRIATDLQKALHS